jgi:hypothetical protein
MSIKKCAVYEILISLTKNTLSPGLAAESILRALNRLRGENAQPHPGNAPLSFCRMKFKTIGKKMN